MTERRGGRTLAVRLDSDGDVLLTGPALRALAAGSERLDLLVSPAGAQAAALLPGIGELLVFDPPWSGYLPPPLDPPQLEALVARLRARQYDQAVIFTSFHQSPLPMALLARMAGVGRVSATSEDYPGSLLDVRHRRTAHGVPDDGGPAGGHEVEAALSLAGAAGFDLPPGDDASLRLAPGAVPSVEHLGIERPYVVLHPAASVPSRSMPAGTARAIGERLARLGWQVVVTGSPQDRGLFGQVASAVDPVDAGGPRVRDLIGATSLSELAGVLAGAACVVVGNTGPAHLAAAVGTPVVSLFSPVVAAQRWAPWQVPCVLLGDQQAPCRGTRARDCPVPGHPCLASVTPGEVAGAVGTLAGRAPVPAGLATGGDR